MNDEPDCDAEHPVQTKLNQGELTCFLGGNR
jgi:hypothetical protein